MLVSKIASSSSILKSPKAIRNSDSTGKRPKLIVSLNEIKKIDQGEEITLQEALALQKILRHKTFETTRRYLELIDTAKEKEFIGKLEEQWEQ